MSAETLQEARRQVEICNACRYCEGYCAVFPAITRSKTFSDGDITQLANLCHNCRGCYYACQYTEPHEFALNLPAALAEVRTDSWREFAWPRGFARLYDRHGIGLVAVLVLALVLLIWGAGSLQANSESSGFYTYLSHSLLVVIFAPAFLLPLVVMAVSLRRYWIHVGGGPLTLRAVRGGLKAAASLRNLDGGQGQGCNFEDEDRYSNARRQAHQLTLWGFMLCFGATVSGTVLHYAFDLQAPYDFFSLPKLLGVPGGLMLSMGTLWLALLKTKADKSLSDQRVSGGDTAFVWLLFWVSTSGLVLYAGTGLAPDLIPGLAPGLAPGLTPHLLTFHLATVLALFITLPWSKMAHGFYRLAALIKDADSAS